MGIKEEIAQFYKDVETLDLRFPVADIHRATKESKGNVSRILNKKMDPSDQFLKRFYSSFKIVPRGGHTESTDSDPKQQILKGPTTATLQDYIDLLQDNYRMMKNVIESGLIKVDISLKQAVENLQEIELQQKVNDSTVMRALDQIVKNDPETLEKEARIVKDAWRKEHGKKDRPVA